MDRQSEKKGTRGKDRCPEAIALQVIALHRNLNDEPMDNHDAAVELINILRPATVVARFIIFAALAMYQHPECFSKLRSGDDEYLVHFVHEVRRFYPFFPFAMARVRKTFNWNDYHFPAGRSVLLDLYGTNHNTDTWEKPGTFNPERFRHWEGNDFNFIPQGGGDYHHNHRCAGEWATIELMKTGIDFLSNEIQYDVPDQNFHVPLSRMPTIPRSRFIISNINYLG